MARTLDIQRDDGCGVLVILGYSNGVRVPLCWEPGCWATIRESSKPTSNCGPPAYRGAVAPAGDAELRIRYGAASAFCVDGVTLVDGIERDDVLDRGCANWGCLHLISWAFVPDPFGVQWEASVCGVKIVRDLYAKPRVDDPLGGKARDPQVLGRKIVRPPVRTTLPNVRAVIGPRGIPGLGGWRYRDLLDDDTATHAGGLSVIDLPPPARHHDGGNGLLPVPLAAAVVLAAVAAALRVRVPQPHGAHAL